VSLDKVMTLTDAMDLQTATTTNGTALMGILAALAVALTLAGIYGVLTRQVQERRKEMGIRLALGGRRGQITRLVVGQAMAVVGIGLVAGVGAALALGRVLQNQLYQVRPHEPRIHLAAILTLAAAALLACLIPAVRAASADPARVLRED
jgi:ABC-type antimicrobial peptide transport system permease subunit